MQRDIELEERMARGEDPWAPKPKDDDDDESNTTKGPDGDDTKR